MLLPVATDRPFSPRGDTLAGLLIIAAALLAYAGTWSAPFVYDDTLAIPQNPTLRRLWPLSDVLFPRVSGGVTVSGRPVLNLSFALNHAISADQPWSYHAANSLIHAVAGLLLFGIIRRTLHRRRTAAADPVALASALLWTLHPLLTQAVTYTVQRAESLMGCLYLATLYAFIRSLDEARPATARRSFLPDAGPNRPWAALSVGACALGMGTKEVMATAPLLVLLYDRTFGAGSLRAAWRQRRGYYLALAGTWLLLAALLLSTGGNRGGTVGLGVGVPLWAYPLTQFTALSQYLALAVWPHPLVFEYGTFWVQRADEVLLPAAVLLPLGAATVLALWRWPAAGFVGAWFFGILAPTSLAPGTIQMIVEHRMYLPLAAVLTGLVALLRLLAGARTLIGWALAAMALAALTVGRNRDYRSHLALWSDTVAKRPLNPRAHEGLAEAFADAGRREDAVRAHQESVRLLPDEAQYHHNLALALEGAGRPEDAIRHYRLALRLQPDQARSHNNLAILLARQGRPQEALPHSAAAARSQPEDPLFHYNLGLAHLRASRWADAAASLETVLHLDPNHADAHFNLGTTLVRLDRLPEALAHYARAQDLRPAEADYALTYGGALLLARRPAEALAQFERVPPGPRATEARYGAGNALAALRRPEDAVAAYQAVLRSDPGHANAHFKLGNSLLDLGRTLEALPHYETARRILPLDAEVCHNLGIACARLERWDAARAAFDEALRLRPDYPDARRSREQLRQVTGR